MSLRFCHNRATSPRSFALPSPAVGLSLEADYAVSATHQTIPTVSPIERALLVSVTEANFASNGGVIPAVNTLYDSSSFKTFFGKDYLKEFEGFKYAEQRQNGAVVKNEGATGTLLFIRTKTNTERETPFLEYEEKRDEDWPAVVQWVKFEQEYGFPLSQNYIQGGSQGIATVPRWLVQYSWIPAMRLKTTVKVKEFLSDVPYPEWATESDEPKPTSVSWDLIGSHGNLGICLHPEILVPGQGNNAGIRVVLTAGTAQSGNSSQRGQKFPRTNHITWTDYTVNTVKRVDGQYYRVQETFIAPILPRASVLEN